MYDNKYKQEFTEKELKSEIWKDIPEYEGLYQVSNLEWCSRKYNMNYGTIKEKTSKSVIMYDIHGNKLKEFKSTRSAGRYLNNENKCSAISNCCNGKRKSAYGYIWKYK